jgi:integrase/recombinase XerD
VQALLRAVDRTTPVGLRDYTLLFLIATYGLRAGEVVALTLDAIDWRQGLFRVPQRKTGGSLLLPLTDAAGTVLLRYLRKGRPPSPQRELFLRARAPAGVFKPTAVSEIFQKWVRRSGLPISFQGPHCLRHSYAVHLLRQGVPLKTLGDLLGHRTAESTCVYLRLASDDLGRVALPLPHLSPGRRSREAQP